MEPMDKAGKEAINMTIRFELDKGQESEYEEWKTKHDKHCKLRGKDGAIGGRISFKFIPTSLGCIVRIKCACNSSDSELDLSHSEDW